MFGIYISGQWAWNADPHKHKNNQIQYHKLGHIVDIA